MCMHELSTIRLSGGLLVALKVSLEFSFRNWWSEFVHSAVVIVQMFEWTWASVSSECTTFLGPSGYGFVQGPGCSHSHLFLEKLSHSYSPGQSVHQQNIS